MIQGFVMVERTGIEPVSVCYRGYKISYYVDISRIYLSICPRVAD